MDVHAPADWKELGEKKRAAATALYAQCLAANEWPGRPPVVNRVWSPSWAMEDEEMEVS